MVSAGTTEKVKCTVGKENETARETVPQAQGGVGRGKAGRSPGASPLLSVNDPEGLGGGACREQCGVTGFVGLSRRQSREL